MILVGTQNVTNSIARVRCCWVLAGSGNFQDSDQYSKRAQQLIADIGIDLDRLRAMNDPEWPLTSMNHSIGLYTSKEHFGEDKIINGHWFAAWHGYDNYKEMIKRPALT